MLPKFLHTQRLTLRLFKPNDPADSDEMLHQLNHPSSIAQMGDYGIRTREGLHKLLSSTLLSADLCPGNQKPEGPVFYFVHVKPVHIASHDSTTTFNSDGLGPTLGGVSLAQRSPSVDPDIGWVFLPEAQGQGYASEAAGELLRWSREDFGIKNVMAWPDRRNGASIRVAQKIGFVEGGKVRDQDGVVHEVWILEGGKRWTEDEVINFWGEDE